MKRICIQMVIMTCMGICFLAAGIVHAQSGSNIDVALVIDSSGSMKKTDPKSLRIPAAQLFISLLDSSDRAAVLSFSDQGYPIADLTPVNNEAHKKELLDAAERITSDGLHTNLYDAFKKGMELLSDAKEEGREQIIVLMSDGMMDVGDHEKDRQLLARLKSELAGALKEQNIKVYAIAFTDQSDRRLLEKLSKQTGGFYNLALTDKDFHLIFTSIFESLKSPEMLPMEKNGFLIDASIREVTIVVSKESSATDIQIHDPDGQTYSGNQQYSGISWFISENFDMITIQKPVEGRWEILYSTGKNNKAYIITDLKLETNFEQLYAVFGENLDIQAWLEKEGHIIKVAEVLETTDIYIELNHPDGNISSLKPLNSGDGIFQKSITLFKDGNYKLRVVAKGKTYEREKAFLFNVANLQESKEDLKAARDARKNEQAEAEGNSGEEEEAPVNWIRIIIQLIFVNLIIGILVIAYMKRQSIKDLKLIGKYFKRFKDTRTFQAKKKEPEESDDEAGIAAEKSSEEEAGETANVMKTLVKLDDAESERKEAEQVDEEEKKEPEKEGAEIEESASAEESTDDTGYDGALDNLEEEIQRLEKLKQQGEAPQASEAIKDTVSDTEEAKAGHEIEEVPAVVEHDAEAKVQMEEIGGEDNVDDMWGDAMNEQAAESSKEAEKTEEQDLAAEGKETLEEVAVDQRSTDKEAEEADQVEDNNAEESVEDMWADAMSEQETAENIEETPGQAVETQKTDDQVPQAAVNDMTEPEPEDKNPANIEVNVETELSEIEEAKSAAEYHALDEEPQLAMTNTSAETQAQEHESKASMPDADESIQVEIGDMWEAALDEQVGVEEAINKTTSADLDNVQEEAGHAEGNSEKDADQIWAEALSDHADAEEAEEKLSEDKNNQEGSPGASR
jgi:hypothetical protein